MERGWASNERNSYCFGKEKRPVLRAFIAGLAFDGRIKQPTRYD